MTAAGKISAEFASRLRRLEPGQQVRVVLLLDTPPLPAQASRQTPDARQSSIDSVKRLAQRALPDIDRILGDHGGRRLSKSPNALGGLTVETTAAGVAALACSHWVKSVMEDQPLKRGW
jgi:thioesterase domain-containing protein